MQGQSLIKVECVDANHESAKIMNALFLITGLKNSIITVTQVLLPSFICDLKTMNTLSKSQIIYPVL